MSNSAEETNQLLTKEDLGYDNYFAFIVKTDNRSQAGHDWVVLFTTKELAEGFELTEIVQGFGELSDFFSVQEWQVVRLCDDRKRFPGCLVCEDEFNPVIWRDPMAGVLTCSQR